VTHTRTHTQRERKKRKKKSNNYITEKPTHAKTDLEPLKTPLLVEMLEATLVETLVLALVETLLLVETLVEVMRLTTLVQLTPLLSVMAAPLQRVVTVQMPSPLPLMLLHPLLLLQTSCSPLQDTIMSRFVAFLQVTAQVMRLHQL